MAARGLLENPAFYAGFEETPKGFIMEVFIFLFCSQLPKIGFSDLILSPIEQMVG